MIFECKSWMTQTSIRPHLRQWKQNLLDHNLVSLVPNFPEKSLTSRCCTDETDYSAGHSITLASSKRVPYDISTPDEASIAITNCSSRTISLLARSENPNWDKLSQVDRHKAIRKVARLLGVIWTDFGQHKERSDLVKLLQEVNVDSNIRTGKGRKS